MKQKYTEIFGNSNHESKTLIRVPTLLFLTIIKIMITAFYLRYRTILIPDNR